MKLRASSTGTCVSPSH